VADVSNNLDVTVHIYLSGKIIAHLPLFLHHCLSRFRCIASTYFLFLMQQQKSLDGRQDNRYKTSAATASLRKNRYTPPEGAMVFLFPLGLLN
jgi:hypothetical protein